MKRRSRWCASCSISFGPSTDSLRSGSGAGPDGRERSAGLTAQHPSWRRFPLAARLAEHTGLPTALDGDAKALALAEGWIGAAVGERDFVAMVVSTGSVVASSSTVG
ncbi:MAG: ROK family protein [Acidimicrobiales bacterium]